MATFTTAWDHPIYLNRNRKRSQQKKVIEERSQNLNLYVSARIHTEQITFVRIYEHTHFSFLKSTTKMSVAKFTSSVASCLKSPGNIPGESGNLKVKFKFFKYYIT